MSIKTARHRLLYFKDFFQGTVYTALSNSRWLTTLTPILALLVRPLLGLTLSTLALLQAWSFFYTAHKNIDGWMTTLSSLGGAVFNNIAAFGGFIARIQGTVFAVAPWFFVAGFSLGTLNQLTLACLNAIRAYESQPGSDQRQHYIQAAIYNIILTVQLASCVTAIVLFNLFPANTFLISAFALTVVSINVGSCLWRFLSSEAKKDIKNELGFGKSEQLKELIITTPLDKKPQPQGGLKHTRLFSTCDHSAVIRKMNGEDAKQYLLDYIAYKLSILNKNTHQEKTQQKIAVLELLEQVILEKRTMPDPGKLHHRYPHLVDNFWCEKSDTQQLLEAVDYYYKNHGAMHNDTNRYGLA
ncbi:hypothetical protein [Legionella sp. km772]|uniref:hypothetical protein n=1 Tax=Legionella sp. km772 TaxID=2498111 RepID=UPI000F8C62A5|nr:hypothetical protein [Legionella sp. km772]RUR06742.1 hypothetical protein ELY15_12925 [Legionella sp. km772]